MTEQIESLLRTHDFLVRQVNRLRYSLVRLDAELQMIQMVLARKNGLTDENLDQLNRGAKELQRLVRKERQG